MSVNERDHAVDCQCGAYQMHLETMDLRTAEVEKVKELPEEGPCLAKKS
jgi:hypothetical protein